MFQECQVKEWFDAIDAKVLTAIIGIIGVIVGVLITHRFASTRDRKNKIRELRLIYFIETYRKILEIGLLFDNPNDTELEQRNSKVKSISQDIQLFGTKEQIKKWLEITNSSAKQENKNSEFRKLLNEFRDRVRTELNLHKINEDVIFQQPKKLKVETSVKSKKLK